MGWLGLPKLQTVNQFIVLVFWGYSMQAQARQRVESRPLTKAEQELALMKAYVKKITSSPEDSRALLQRAGILDKKGELTKPYRS